MVAAGLKHCDQLQNDVLMVKRVKVCIRAHCTLTRRPTSLSGGADAEALCVCGVDGVERFLPLPGVAGLLAAAGFV
jgi:hypothetical protein